MGRLSIVTGANGALGRAYLEGLRESGEDCCGISRSTVTDPVPGAQYWEGVDLGDPAGTENVLRSITAAERDIVLVHPVGKFLFEEHGPPSDRDADGIDDDVYRSNILTFRNVTGPLLDIAARSRAAVQVTLCGFGSVSDQYMVPYWQSYSRSKDIVRADIRRRVAEGGGRVRGLFVNVSTVDTGNENLLRPYADKRYWLKPMEVVRASLAALLGKEEGWREISVICQKPDVDPTTHYDPDVVLERWKREMGVSIPSPLGGG